MQQRASRRLAALERSPDPMSFLRKILGGGGPGRLRAGAGGYLSPEQRLQRLVPAPRGEARYLVEWARELVGTGEVVWDVGAGTGLFSLASAIRAGSNGVVVAVEAKPARAAAIRRAAEVLGAPDARLEVIEAEAAELSENAGGGSPAGGHKGGVTRRLTLDELAAGRARPTLVRLAVGRRLGLVVEGALGVLRAARPVLLLEVPSHLVEPVGFRLHGFRYEYFDATCNPSDRLKLERPTERTLAVPR
jgi:hypothetical protein